MYDVEKSTKGELSCVGVGMCLGSHITPLSKSYIENAEICYVAVSDALVEQWVFSMNSNAISLQSLYAKGKSRNKTYKEMEELILNSVFQGLKVCCVFYGHPGIFALVPHRVIEKVRAKGIVAIMEPGISAEDTLYSDLGIDPGQFGCQHYEASHLIMYQKVIDPTSYLILWQMGVIGDIKKSNFEPNMDALSLLVELLYEYYEKDHEIVIYEAKTLPIENIRADKIRMEQLTKVKLNPYTTIVIPPAGKPKPNRKYSIYLEKCE